MLAHYRLLLWVTAIATIFIIFDEIFETFFFDATGTSDIQSGSNGAAFWIGRGKDQPADSSTHTTLRLQEQFITVPLDHANPEQGSYQQRYWILTDYYTAGGPVFVHDVGEVDAEPSAHRFLEQSSSYLRELLREFRGVGIVWEHRYYGKSIPIQFNQSAASEYFHYLNLKQSLSDLPYFAWNFQHPELSHLDLTPVSTPWIMIGCSYSGMRAAFSRQLYPNTFYATYAASAPVHLTSNLNTFFDPIYDKLVDRGYTGCARDLHAAMQYLDIQLSTPRSAAKIKTYFLGPGAENNNNGDFTLAVANIFSYFQSSGIERGKHSLGSLCRYLREGLVYDKNLSWPEEGIATRYGARPVLERLAAWPELVPLINSHFDTNCTGRPDSPNLDCDLGKVDTDMSSITWTWQLCSELGLFTTQNAGTHSLVSRYQSVEYRKSLCARQFPLAHSTNVLPELPLVEVINSKTGGRFMRPSNVFWTAGQYDPWRSLTPLAKYRNAIDQFEQVVVSNAIPACNVSTNVTTMFGHVMEDAQHCLDYSTKSDEAVKARRLFAEALRTWLPCFKGNERPATFLPWD